jgi:3-hydroxyisobutyrate dehydrogenase
MTLAVLGTGIMGAAMARNWLSAGETVRVWNRTRSRAEPLAEAGGTVCDSPAEAVSGADTIISMLYDAKSVSDAIGEAASGLVPGALWLQMSTVGVPGADELGELAANLGLVYVDAPVMGTRQPAEQGKLTVLASGPDEVRERVERVVAPVSVQVEWLGAAGAASRLKLVMNSWVLMAVVATAQTTALADGLGIDPNLFLNLIKGGPLDMGYAHAKGAAMMAREYPTSFSIEGAAKDGALITDLARQAGIDESYLDTARRLVERAIELGHGDADMAAVYEAIRHPS